VIDGTITRDKTKHCSLFSIEITVDLKMGYTQSLLLQNSHKCIFYVEQPMWFAHHSANKYCGA